jgi:hypothetical protein
MSTIWRNTFNEAVRLKHPDPMKVADSAVRWQANGTKIKNARRSLQLINKKPPGPSPVPMKKKAAIRCKVINHGTHKQCAYGAKMAGFCMKHWKTVA